MARKSARPGRRLIIFGLLVAALYGGVAAAGQWQPKLGLDLQGGTRITLEASTPNGGKPSPANLEEARAIIDQADATSSWRSPARIAPTWWTRSSRPPSSGSGWSR